MTLLEPSEHPLATMIMDAASGRYPDADGLWHRVPAWRPGVQAVVAFTGHAVLAGSSRVSDERLMDLGMDGYGGAHHPRLMAHLAGDDGWVDSLDALLVARVARGPGLVDRPDLADHPRVEFARGLRDDIRVMGYPDRRRSDLAVVSRGIAGLTELSVELEPTRRGSGAGSKLVADALASIHDGRLVVAAVAPGNAASLRAFLSAGFQPVASVQLFRSG
jgi:GNAT superfamily N-acetyltransferase